MPARDVPTPQLVFFDAPPDEDASEGVKSIDLRAIQIDEFLQARAEQAKRSLSPNTLKAYRQDLQRFLEWSDKSWDTVTPRDIARFKTALTEQKKFAPTTVNRVLVTLGNFFRWRVDLGQMEVDPTTAIAPLPLPEPEAQELSIEEVKRIYAIAATRSYPERETALVSVLLQGLRAKEVSVLNLEDFEGSRLLIRKAEREIQGVVPLRTQTIADLKAYLDWRTARGETLEPSSPLFLSHSRRSRGQRLTEWGVRDVIEAIRKATQIDLHAQRFRHTFALDLVVRGMDPHQVMTLTRHKSVQSFKRYTQCAQQVAAEQAFYEAIGESPPQSKALE